MKHDNAVAGKDGPTALPASTRAVQYANVVSAFEEIALTTMAGDTGLEQVLRLIGRRLCELIGVSRCTVYLRRDEENFQCHVGWARAGDMGDEVRSLVTGRDRMTAEAVHAREPILVRDAQRDPRPNQRAMKYFGVRDLLVVPLVVSDAVIGMIYIDNEERPHEYTDADMSTARAFGILAAIAIRQGELHKELEARHRTIVSQNRNLNRLSQISTELTEIMLAGGDLQSVLDRVQQIAGLPVLVYGPDLALIAASLPERMEHQRPPTLPRNALRVPRLKDLVIQGLRETVEIPPIPAIGSHHRRLINPMTIGRRHQGFLEFVEQGRRFAAFDSKILAQATFAVALKLLTDIQHGENADLARRDFLSDVLHGQREPGLLSDRAHVFGVRADAQHVLVRISYGVESASYTGTTRRGEIEAELRNELGRDYSLLGTGVPGADLFLITLPDEVGPAHVESALSTYFPRVQRKGAQYLFVCPPVCGLAKLPRHSEEARAFENALEDLGTASQSVLMRQMPLVALTAVTGGLRQAAEYAADLVDPICAADPENVLMPTVRSFLASDGKIRASAKTLGVHENTVRYRLERVSELTGLDLQNLGDVSRLRFVMQVHGLRPA
ncbi:helix-turn-helix domain-containing protein [Cumulibacter soli]|uniref:helix-turn-helix domain-containing protein n=1 Tax=Cumulibacter soli TaxID=2546344 RepID=UPI00141964AE|nr:GAF domain-containing protein [Cumulibacter soli]